jgi:hypothetical protein
MPTVSAAPSMARYSATAWPAIIAASWTISRVRASSALARRISSKAKLSKYSISSGSVRVRVETCSGNSSSWFFRASAVGIRSILSTAQ